MEEKLLEQYKKLRVDLDTLKLVNDKLKLPEGRLTSLAKEKRLEALKEAISWESGPDQENRKITVIYKFGKYSVAVGKPGKEAAPDYDRFIHYKTKERGNNPQDMNPQILKNGRMVGKNATFEDMFGDIEKLKHEDLFGLELLGMLIFRAAFMLDHKKDNENNWRYNPSEDILEELEKRIPEISGVPIKVYLHFLEILSLNEDIKVNEGGYGDFTQDYGRINTLLTFAHLIAVILNRRPLYKFAGQFARPPSGMAPLVKTEKGGLFEAFPLLNPALFEGPIQQTLQN